MFKQYVKLINYLFNLRPGVLIKTLSHIWGRLNLPLLLFRVGLLTLMKMDSLIYLDIWCPSLPIILKLFWLMGWLVASVLSQAGSPQASPEDSTLAHAESALSQAGSPRAGSSQASPEDSTLSPAESELSQGSSPSSPEDGTLQAESTTPPQAVRCSARLRARQAGNPSRVISKVSQ